MSIPTLENTNLNNKISELQMEYAYITFYDTFVHANKLIFITFALEAVISVFLLAFIKQQILICALSLLFMAIVQVVINHITLIPLMTVFPK